MSKEEASLLSLEPIKVTFPPHHHCIFRVDNFARISDALAELVDNSIQACFNAVQDSHEVHISVHLSLTDGFVVVYDNGCGMTPALLNEFAIHSFSKEDRDKEKGQTYPNPVKISKFGVGAKNGGFFLGDRLRVVTKVRDDSRVFVFEMNEKETNAKFEQGQRGIGIYSGTIFPRRREDVSSHASETEKIFDGLMEEFHEHEVKNDQFTYVVIHLRDSTLYQLSHQFLETYQQLADTYHFYIHPEHAPPGVLDDPTDSGTVGAGMANGPVTRMSSSAGAGGGGTSSSRQGRPGRWAASSSSQAASVENKKLDRTKITVSKRFSGRSVEFNRLELGCMAALLPPGLMELSIHHSKSRLDFVFEIPRNLLEANAIVTASRAGPENVVIRGSLFYFPLHDSVETRPSLPLLMEGSQSLSSTFPSSSSSCLTSTHLFSSVDAARSRSGGSDSAIGGGTGTDRRTALSVYWEGRLVPETVLEKLPFFDDFNTDAKCETSKVAVKWKNRVFGVIFLDSSFSLISNNKLRLRTAPSLEELLVEEKHGFRPNVRPFRDQLKVWLQNCAKLDDEFEFFVRLQRDSGHKEVTLFNNLKIAGTTLDKSTSLKVREGDSAISVTPIDYAVKEKLPPSQVSYKGNGEMRCFRLPRNAFDSEVLTVPVSRILRDSEGIPQQLSIDFMEELGRRAVASVQMFAYEGQPTPLPITNTTRILVGQQFKMVGVQLKDAADRLIFHQPEAPGRKFVIHIYTKAERSEIVELATIEKVSLLGSNGKTSFKDVKDQADWTKMFYECRLTFKTVGPLPLTVEVKDGARVVHTETITVQVVNKDVKRITLEPCNPEEWSQPLRLGSRFPSFTVNLLDTERAPCAYLGNVCVEIIACAEMSVGYSKDGDGDFRDTRAFCTLLATERGVITFDGDLWRSLPKPPSVSSFLSDDIESRTVRFQLTVKSAVRVNATRNTPGELLAPPTTFELTFMAGPPESLALLEPLQQAEYKPGDVLPPLSIACFDRFGYRTAPLTTTKNDWKITLMSKKLRFGRGGKITQPITTDGSVYLTGVQLNLIDGETVPLLGMDIECNAVLMRSVSQVNEDRTLFGDFEAQPAISIPLRLVPSRVPRVVKLLQDGRLLGPDITCTVGSCISKLSFVLLEHEDDDLDDAVEVDEPREVAAYLVDWDIHARERAITSAAAVLPIEVPDEAGHHIFTLTVRLGLDTLTYTLSVNAIADAPYGWKQLCSDDIAEGIMAGETNHLCSKISGVVLVDSHDNVCALDEENGGHSGPTLVISQMATSHADDENTSGSDDQQTESLSSQYIGRTKRKTGGGSPGIVGSAGGGAGGVGGRPSKRVQNGVRKSDEIPMQPGDVTFNGVRCRGFVLPPGSSLHAKSGTLARLQVLDLSRPALKCKTLTFPVLPGLPRQIKFFCASAVGMAELASFHHVAVSRYQKLEDVVVILQDNDGNSVAHDNRVKLSVVRKLMGSSESVSVASITFQAGRLRCTIPIDFAPSSAEVPEELQLIGQYHHRASSRSHAQLNDSFVLNPAVLHCRVSDVLIAHRVVVEFVNAAGQPIHLLRCDSEMAALRVSCLKEDGSSFPLSTVDCLTLSLSISGQVINVNDYFDAKKLYKGNVVVWRPVARDIRSERLHRHAAIPTGELTASICYKDANVAHAHIAEDRKTLNGSVSLTVIGGKSCNLRLDPALTNTIRSSVATTATSITTQNELVTIRLFDRFGNPTDVEEGHSWMVMMSKAVNLVLSPAISRFQHADSSGAVAGVMLPDRTGATFDLSLQGPLADGVCTLMVEFFTVSAEAGVRSHSTSLQVKVIADEKVLELRQSLESVQLLLRDHYDDWRNSTENLKANEDSVRESLATLSSDDIPTVRQLMDTAAQEALETLSPDQLTQAESQLRARVDSYRTQCKPRRHDRSVFNPVAPGAVPGGRWLVSMGYCDDDKTADILSWAASRFMECYVVDTREQAIELCDRGVAAWAMSSIRSAATARDRSPPLAGVGNPTYLVDCIQLDHSDEIPGENLRDTLFSACFKDSILVDDAASARALVAQFDSDRLPVPTLYTRDGRRLMDDQVMDPRDTIAAAPLPTVFGRFPEIGRAQLAAAEKDLALCTGDLKKLFQQRHELTQKLRRLEDASLEAKVAKLADEESKLLQGLRALGVTDVVEVEVPPGRKLPNSSPPKRSHVHIREVADAKKSKK